MGSCLLLLLQQAQILQTSPGLQRISAHHYNHWYVGGKKRKKKKKKQKRLWFQVICKESCVHKGQDFGTTDKDGSFAKFFFTVIQRSLLYQLLDLCNEVFGKFWNNSKSP